MMYCSDGYGLFNYLPVPPLETKIIILISYMLQFTTSLIFIFLKITRSHSLLIEQMIYRRDNYNS